MGSPVRTLPAGLQFFHGRTWDAGKALLTLAYEYEGKAPAPIAGPPGRRLPVR